MREAVIVAARRTPIGKAYRGAFNATHGATLGAHALRAVVEDADMDPTAIDDIAMGVAMPQGEVRGGDHVRGRRHGGGRPLRNLSGAVVTTAERVAARLLAGLRGVSSKTEFTRSAEEVRPARRGQGG